ncbi:uncharacterized protein LOC118751986 [Rhagoletis pomonella]|uniref:uncharacterized protein LOC118751986 n=1 Tax=Rhagoletis pomonella TaxID=28610 RepID=UPI001783C1BA|nr:uncharacterized protein LOC118751986 [Rhagoletis pomonella]
MEIQQQLIHILKQRGLNLRKWCANHPQLLQNVSMEEQEVDIDFDNDINQTIKTLGLTWMPKMDRFCVKVCLGSCSLATKHSVSADLARLFDLLGILAPIVVMAKMFIQDLWQLKLTWDEALPADLNERWTTFRNDLQKLDNMQVSRHVFEGYIPAKIQIHVFSDASEKAYGAAIYIRSELDEGRVQVRLLCAKSRVAPLKWQTILRLELCASVLGAQLTTRVKSDLKLDDVATYFWTDSQIVLAWINSSSASYQTFVANRIAVIHEHTTAEQWRHISSKDNPADILSRGLPPGRLETCNMWFYGQTILLGKEDTWPSKYSKALSVINEGINMERKGVTSVAVATTGHEGSVLYSIRHNGSFKTLQRVAGYMLRFINQARNQSRESDIPLTVHELEKALVVIVHTMQQSDFEEELQHLKKYNEFRKNSSFSSLSPFLDNNGIIRVGGRLQASELAYDAKHPMLIPHNNSLAKLLVQMIHKENRHCGPQALLAYTRQRPIKGKLLTRSIVLNCVRCTKAKPKLMSQIMGNLPSTRVTPARPFINSGVDFCGPFWVHFKIRGKKPQKAYVAVFCCFATKAVHLELVSDLTTDALFGALKRFISRRGHCQNVYCDNATNFVGAKNHLSELTDVVYGNSSRESIVKQCSGKGITFHFIPPRTPHFGGLWEAAVKSASTNKKHLAPASLAYEELDTIIIEVEGILNSRPISPMSDNPNDLTALTPGHFLIGEPLNAQVDPTCRPQQTNLLTRWKLVSHLKREFWNRWSREYLSDLQLQNKWKTQHNNINVGDMVIIKEDNTPVLQWPLGRTINVYEGNDGVVRVADVKTASGTCKRPIHRLAPLPKETNDATERQ